MLKISYRFAITFFVSITTLTFAAASEQTADETPETPRNALIKQCQALLSHMPANPMQWPLHLTWTPLRGDLRFGPAWRSQVPFQHIHAYAFDEVVFVAEGKVNVEIEGQMYEFDTGSVIVIPAMAAHRFVPNSPTVELLRGSHMVGGALMRASYMEGAEIVRRDLHTWLEPWDTKPEIMARETGWQAVDVTTATGQRVQFDRLSYTMPDLARFAFPVSPRPSLTFERVRIRSGATFTELDPDLPSRAYSIISGFATVDRNGLVFPNRQAGDTVKVEAGGSITIHNTGDHDLELGIIQTR